MEIGIDTKKRVACNFFILACPGCFWQDRAFEVAERSEVGALESLASTTSITNHTTLLPKTTAQY